MRLRTLPLAFSSILTGTALALDRGSIKASVLVFALITTLFLQVLSNLANDYGDFKKGTDSDDRIGPPRAVQSGWISPEIMMRAIIILSVLALISGITLIYFAFGSNISTSSIAFLILGILAIVAAVKYTIGDNPYGYIGLGDISVFLFFGLLGVAGTYFLFNLQYEWMILLPACSIGLFSAGVLNLNNMRDYDGDKANGKRTLAVILGNKGARNYHTAILSIGWITMLTFSVYQDYSGLKYLFLLSAPLFISHVLRLSRLKNNKLIDPELRRLALSTFLFSLLLCLGEIFN